MKKIIFILGLLLVFNALAQRVVGNGGGEAEMKALLIKENLQNWIQFCNLDKNHCQNQSKISSAVIAKLDLPLTFSPLAQGEFLCQSHQVTMSHEDLYLNNKSISDNNIFKKVFLAYLTCAGEDLSVINKINFDFNPIARTITHLNVVVFNHYTEDYVFSADSMTDLHTDILNETGCTAYSVISSHKKSFEIQCLNSEDRYLVYPQISTANKLFLQFLFL